MQTTKLPRWNLNLGFLLSSLALPGLAQQKTHGEEANRAVSVFSRRAVAALQKNDTATLARLMHPKGLRFAPYANFSKRDLILSRLTVAAMRHSSRVYSWGISDGSGDPIRLSWNAFRRRYLTPQGKDFLMGEVHLDALKTRSNLKNNLHAAYADAAFVYFRVPGTPKYSGMNWRGLWLAWRPIGKNWYLCAVAGDQWVI